MKRLMVCCLEVIWSSNSDVRPGSEEEINLVRDVDGYQEFTSYPNGMVRLGGTMNFGKPDRPMLQQPLIAIERFVPPDPSRRSPNAIQSSS